VCGQRRLADRRARQPELQRGAHSCARSGHRRGGPQGARAGQQGAGRGGRGEHAARTRYPGLGR
jgi:hypothetical protein